MAWKQYFVIDGNLLFWGGFLFLVWSRFSFSLLGNAPHIVTTEALALHKAFDVLKTERRPLSSSLASAFLDLYHPAKLRAKLEGQMAFTIKDKLMSSKGFFPILLSNSSKEKNVI